MGCKIKAEFTLASWYRYDSKVGKCTCVYTCTLLIICTCFKYETSTDDCLFASIMLDAFTCLLCSNLYVGAIISYKPIPLCYLTILNQIWSW